jgi:hypothetical protein
MKILKSAIMDHVLEIVSVNEHLGVFPQASKTDTIVGSLFLNRYEQDLSPCVPRRCPEANHHYVD